MPKQKSNGSGMMRKRADNSWEYRRSYGYDLSGKLMQKSFYGKTQAECRRKRDEYDKQAVNITSIQTVEQWALKWLEIYKKGNCSIDTYRQYETLVTKYIIPTLGRSKLMSVKPAHILEFMNLHKTKSQSHVNKLRITMNSIFDTAIDNDLCVKNPVKNVRVEGVKTPEKAIFSDEELKIIVDSCLEERSNISDALFTLLHTGVRREELLGLMWKDIDFDNDVISINRAVIAQEGKKTLKNTLKNDYSKRVIPLFPPVKEMLQSRDRSSDFVFPTVSGEYYSPHRFNMAFKRLLERINRVNMQKAEKEVADDNTKKTEDIFTPVSILTPHNCRHTFASQLLKKGVDIKIIQMILGHSDISMTGNVYTHVDVDTIKAATQYFKL